MNNNLAIMQNEIDLMLKTQKTFWKENDDLE